MLKSLPMWALCTVLCFAGTVIGQEEAEAVDTIPPSPVDSITVDDVTTGTVQLHWSPSTDNTDELLSYTVFVNGITHSTTPDTSMLIDGLEPASTCSITVYVLDFNFNEAPPGDTAIVVLDSDTEIPQAPANLAVVDKGACTFSFKWNEAVDDGAIKEYVIKVDDDEEYTKVIRDTMLTIWHLDPAVEYSVAVKAIDYADQESPWSDPLAVTTDEAKAKIMMIANKSHDVKDKRVYLDGDAPMVKHLSENGYFCKHFHYANMLPNAEHADTFDCAIASSTIKSSLIGGVFQDTETPFILHEVYVAGEMGLSKENTEVLDSTTSTTVVTDTGYQRYKYHNTSITMINSTHPLSAGLSGTFRWSSDTSGIKWIIPAESATNIAHVEGLPDHIVLCGYERGDTLYDSSIAVGRRVVFGLNDENPITFTEDGWKLFDATIEWALAGKIPVRDPFVFTRDNFHVSFSVRTAPRMVLLSVPAQHGYSVFLTDLRGVSIRSFKELQTAQCVIDLHGVPAGTYILSVKGNTGIATRKFILP
jgi:hypothetical protein